MPGSPSCSRRGHPAGGAALGVDFRPDRRTAIGASLGCADSDLRSGRSASSPPARSPGRASSAESGAGSISLDVDDETFDSLETALGLRAHARFEVSEGSFFAPEFFGRWLHEFGDLEREFRASFAGAPDVPFCILGAELPRDSALVIR
jgi:hypothetical protein